MEPTAWEQIKTIYKLGQFVQGTVEFHAPFGVFLNLDNPQIKSLIKITDFLDEGDMNNSMYPKIGVRVGAIVIGYNEKTCREIYLSAKPSILHKALVPLQNLALVN
jgi:ribosomal protein S1